MKFKVGDKVVAKKDAPYSITTNGWVGTVTEVTAKHFKADTYMCLNYEYFDKLNEDKIVITTKGDKVIANLYEGKKIIKSAEAKCSPDDEFDFKIGAKLAFERLVGTNEVREVKREAKVGEYIKIVKPFMSNSAYKRGDILKVIGVEAETIGTISNVRVKEFSYPIVLLNEYVVLENYTPAKDEIKDEVKEEPKFKPGDAVIMTSAYADVPKGTRGTVVKRTGEGWYLIDFHVRYECTHDGDCLKDKTGLWLGDTWFEKV